MGFESGLETKFTGKRSKSLKLFTETINAGEHASLGLPMPELLGYAPLYMPVKVAHGRKEGPTCLLVASMRGDEYNGMEIIKDFLGRSALERLQGTVIAVPVVNVFGMLNRSPYLPGNNLLEDAFPGSENGNYAARTAHMIMTTLFAQCDLCVSFTCGELNHRVLPHIYGDFSDPVQRALAEAFPVSVLADKEPGSGSLASSARELKKPLLTYQAGEALRVNRPAIRQGARGLLRMFRKLGMLPAEGSQGKAERDLPVVSNQSEWVYATKSGISHFYKQLGDRVSKGERLARINEPLGSFQEVTIHAPHEGIIVGVNDMPMVFEGDCLFRIARFEALDQAASAVESWPVEAEVTTAKQETEADTTA